MIELPLITIHLSNYILKNIKALLRQNFIFSMSLSIYIQIKSCFWISGNLDQKKKKYYVNPNFNSQTDEYYLRPVSWASIDHSREI